MKIFELFKIKREDANIDFPKLIPLDIKNDPLVLMRKEEEDMRGKYQVSLEKKGYFIEVK